MQHTDLLLREQLTSLAGSIPFGIIATDQTGTVTLANRKVSELLSLENVSDLIDQPALKGLERYTDLASTFEVMLNGQGSKYTLENFPLGERNLRISMHAYKRGYYIFIEDISNEQTAKELTLIDSLTSLANRDSFIAVVGDLLKNPSKLKHHLIYLDLDHFKPINELAGRINGDRVLRHVANLLRKHTRNSDRIMRISGDEFCVLTYRDTTQEVKAIAQRIQNEISRAQFNFNNMPFSVTASICVADISQSSTTDPEEFLNLLDRVCQRSKSLGRNSISFLEQETDSIAEVGEAMAWLPRLDQAIQTDQIELFGQRIQDLRDLEKVKVEVLIRLIQDQEIYPPTGLIRAAERYNRIAELDFWVIEQVFNQAKAGYYYSINLSGKTLGHPMLVEYISRQMQNSFIDPGHITFEITETAVIQDLEQAKEVTENLHNMGFLLALDDFGSGYSSFSYLRALKFDVLKIDGVFIKELDSDPFLQVMVKSITELCHELNMEVVAEYVCCESVMQAVLNCNVDHLQGYQIHKPEQLAQALTETLIQ